MAAWPATAGVIIPLKLLPLNNAADVADNPTEPLQ